MEVIYINIEFEILPRFEENAGCYHIYLLLISLAIQQNVLSKRTKVGRNMLKRAITSSYFPGQALIA